MPECLRCPCLCFGFFGVVVFVLAFFVQTTINESDVVIYKTSKNDEIETYNTKSSILNSDFNLDNKKLFLKINEVCYNLNETIINNEYLQNTQTFNKIIKISIFAAFGISCLIFLYNGFIYLVDVCFAPIKTNNCCSMTNDKSEGLPYGVAYSIIISFTIICVHLITFCILSIINHNLFNTDILNRCGFIYYQDYEISEWETSNDIIITIMSLFLFEFVIDVINFICAFYKN